MGMPVWIYADSHSLMLALEHLMRAVARPTGKSAFDIEARARRGVRLRGGNVGRRATPSAIIESWLEEPPKGTIGNRTVRQIVERHDSELWSKPKADGGACLRLPLGKTERPQTVRVDRPSHRGRNITGSTCSSPDTALTDTPFRKLRYVVFDTETTGLRPTEGDELIAIGAVRMVNGRILTGETFERLINPGRSIPVSSVRIHGITEDMARDKPPARIVLAQFKNFVGDGVLVAWNAAFDMRFLELKQEDAGVRFNNPVLDALLLSIYVSNDPINHSLMATAERLGVVVTGRHTALGDAMATAAIWVRLLDLLAARGIRTLGQAFRISSRLVAERRQLAQF